MELKAVPGQAEVVTYRFADSLLDPVALLVLTLLHLHAPTATQNALCRFTGRLGVCIRVDCQAPSRDVCSCVRAG